MEWGQRALSYVRARSGFFWAGVVAWLVIVLFSFLYIRLGYLNEMHLRNGFDLGTYTQILSNVSHGSIPPFNTLKGMVAWGDHAHFAFALFAPLFWIVPSPLTVLVIQALVITTSAWALFAIAQDRLKSYLFSFTVLLSYLLFFGVQYALDVDFHANVLTAAALAWSFYAFHFKKWRLFWVVFGIGLLTREDAAVFYAMFAIYILAASRGKMWRAASWMFGLSILYFFTVAYFVMPMWEANGTPLAYFDIPANTRNPIELAMWIITNPITIFQNMTQTGAARNTMQHLVQSFGYLSLASPFTYLLAAPNFLARFLSPEEQRHLMTGHYSVSLVSILSYGSILGTVGIRKLIKKFFGGGVLFRAAPVLAAAGLLWGSYVSSWSDIELPLRRFSDVSQFEQYYGRESVYGTVMSIRSRIGAADSVAATSGLVPAFATRSQIYALPDPNPITTDWVVITMKGNRWPLSAKEVNEIATYLKVEDEGYEYLGRENEVLVFRRASN